MNTRVNAQRARIMRIAALTALLGNTVLASLKISFGLYAGSLAVVGDGIDSSVDGFIALMSLVVAAVVSRPADPGHPWGHGRAETVATALLAFSLFFAGSQLVLNSALKLYSGAISGPPAFSALVVTLVSIVGKVLLALSQFLFGKQADSAMLRANAKNMAADVIISAGVLVGLLLARLTGFGFIDSALAILVGLWVIKAAVGIFIEANMELMDGGSSTESYRAVFDAVHSVPGAGNPHRTRMRRIAGLWDIDIDIEVAPDMTVQEAHAIASEVEKAIKERVEGIYDIMVHVEPSGGASHEAEGYGLRADDVF